MGLTDDRWKNITLIWDRGFVSKKNVDLARKSNLHLISAGVNSISDVIDLISRPE